MKTARAVTAAAAVFLLGACGAEQATQIPLATSSAPQCTETAATPAATRPSMLATTTGSWYGTADLWVGLPDHAPTAQGTSLVLKFPWVTLDEDKPTAELGAPVVSAERAGGPGPVTATVAGYARSFGTGGLAFWPATIEFPGPGCWTVTGRLNNTTVQFVVDVTQP